MEVKMISKETQYMFKFEDPEGNNLKIIRHMHRPAFVLNIEQMSETKVINQLQLYIPDNFDLRIIIAAMEELIATPNIDGEES